MTKHFNLYYLFLEDQQKNPMDEVSKKKIQKNIENYYREIKPPGKSMPPNSRGDEDPGNTEEGEKNETQENPDDSSRRGGGIDDPPGFGAEKEKIKNF